MKKNEKLAKVEPVHLKPIFGMKPGLWLTLLYSILLLLLVFLIGFLPGIKNPVVRVSFTSAAYNSAVYLDGSYIGGTPFETAVLKGTHNVSYKVNGQEIDSFSIDVKGRTFLCWLFPAKQSVESSKPLTETAYNALTEEFFDDLAHYSAVLEYDSVNNYPPLYSDYAKCISSYENADLSVLTDYAFLFASTSEMKQDALNACEILGLSFSFDTLKESSAPSVSKQSFSKDSLGDIDGYKFNGFSISRTAITEAQYMAFVKENPMWDSSNTNSLIELGLVTDNYLQDVGSSSVKPVRNISYYAALAYCDYLSQKTGKYVSLPTEVQWMISAVSSTSTWQSSLIIPSSDEPCGMLGGVWEMTGSFYVPLEGNSDIQAFISLNNIDADIIVKGGCYANKTNSFDENSRGTSTKALCSDFMGFRIIWN